MGLQAVPLGLADPTIDHPVELWRNLHKYLFQSRAGVMGPDQANLSKVSGSLALTISKFGMIVPGTETSLTQGSYFVWADEDETLTWPGPAGSTRHDSLLLRVVDDQYGAITGQARAEWDVVEGVAGAGAARPNSDFDVGGPLYEPGAWLRVGNVEVLTTDTTELDTSRITKIVRHNPVGAGPFVYPNYLDMVNKQGVLPELYGGMLSILQDRYGLYVREASGAPRQIAGRRELAYSGMVNSPPLNVTGTWTAFTGTDWPAFNFTAPESGRVNVHIGGEIGNDSTANATCRLGFALSGGHTLGADHPRSLSGSGTRNNQSTRIIRVSGITPGASVTVTPYWYTSATSGGMTFNYGSIQVEADW